MKRPGIRPCQVSQSYQVWRQNLNGLWPWDRTLDHCALRTAGESKWKGISRPLRHVHQWSVSALPQRTRLQWPRSSSSWKFSLSLASAGSTHYPTSYIAYLLLRTVKKNPKTLVHWPVKQAFLPWGFKTFCLSFCNDTVSLVLKR